MMMVGKRDRVQDNSVALYDNDDEEGIYYGYDQAFPVNSSFKETGKSIWNVILLVCHYCPLLEGSLRGHYKGVNMMRRGVEGGVYYVVIVMRAAGSRIISLMLRVRQICALFWNALRKQRKVRMIMEFCGLYVRDVWRAATKQSLAALAYIAASSFPSQQYFLCVSLQFPWNATIQMEFFLTMGR